MTGSKTSKKRFGAGPYASIKNKNENLQTFYSLDEMDVLCGRGNGINMRRGNVEFRNHVESLKQIYAEAERQEKIKIARQVVESVRSNGGRFVKFKYDPSQEVYVEIGMERAVEKACQALREGCGKKKQEIRKMKRTVAKGQIGRTSSTKKCPKAPSVGSSKVRKRTASSKLKQVSANDMPENSKNLWQVSRRRSNASGMQYYDDSEDDSHSGLPSIEQSTDSDSMGSNNSDDDFSSGYPHDTQSRHLRRSSSPEQVPTHRLMMPSAAVTNATDEQLQSSGWFCDFMNGGSSEPSVAASQNWEALFTSLVQWKEIHGHCAIPPSAGSPHPDSSREEKEHARLADWSSVQRQIYREIQKGHRKASDEEEVRFNRLQALGFVWDYERWHWDRRYKELLQFLQEEEGTKGSSLRRGKKGTNTRDDFSKCLGLALWLNEQRRLYNDGVQGKIHEMRDDRARKLEKINFSLVDFSIQGVGLSAIPKRAIALPVPPGLTKKSSVEAVSTRRAASTATKKSSSVPPNADPRETAVPDDVTRKQVLHKDHPVVAYVTPYNSTHRMWNYPASPSSAGSPVKPIALGDAMRFEEKTPDIAGKPPIANVCVSPVSNADDSAAAKTISSMETSQQAKAIGKLPAQ